MRPNPLIQERRRERPHEQAISTGRQDLGDKSGARLPRGDYYYRKRIVTLSLPEIADRAA